jgi:hypothetical protein
MAKEEVLAEHYSHQNNGGVNVRAIAVTDKRTQYVDGVPVDGFCLQLGLDYDLQGLQQTSSRLLISEDDLFNLANALAGAGYKLREARKKLEKGRDRETVA